MSLHHIVGIAFLFTGLLDVALALVILGPHLPEERRRVVQGALLAGGAVLLALGTAFLSGALHA